MLPSIGAGYVIGAICVMPFADFQPYTIAQIGYLFVNGAIILPVAIGLLSIGPRYLPAAEVSMFTVLEVILAPFLVWLVLGENPGGQSLIGARSSSVQFLRIPYGDCAKNKIKNFKLRKQTSISTLNSGFVKPVTISNVELGSTLYSEKPDRALPYNPPYGRGL